MGAQGAGSSRVGFESDAAPAVPGMPPLDKSIAPAAPSSSSVGHGAVPSGNPNETTLAVKVVDQALDDAERVRNHLDLVARIVADVAEKVADRRSSGIEEVESDEIRYVESLTWNLLTAYVQEGSLSSNALDLDAEHAVVRRVRAELYGLGGFETYLDDPTIENMYVNGSDRVFVNRAGALAPERVPPVTRNDEDLVELINRWAARAGRMERRFDIGNPRLDLRLPTGHRLHAIMEVTQRPTITIRFPHHKTVTLEDQLNFKTVSPQMAQFLRAAVKARCNIIVAGGTGAGKTTMLRALLLEASPDERIITIEDTPELNLASYEDAHPNVVEMETRQANSEGKGELSMMELTRECLRMSPDRVVIGEVRGAEALYMLKAMSQGNDGSMCTLHADSARGVAGRVRAYCAEGAHGLPMSVIDSFFINAVDLILHIRQLPNRRRVVSAIYEVEKSQGDQIRYNEVFAERANDVGEYETAPSPLLKGRLRGAGLDI